jgi:hypothetical protein
MENEYSISAGLHVFYRFEKLLTVGCFVKGDRTTQSSAQDYAGLKPNRRPPAMEIGEKVIDGAKETRTPDPLHAMQVRYQLRYSPMNPYL